MNICLINAPYIDIYGPIKVSAGRYFPLGLGYIAAVLKENGHKVFLLDPEAEGINYATIAKRIEESNPDVIGISSATPNFPYAVKIAKIAKNLSIPTILGGSHASSLPELILEKHREIDIVVIGEGEITMSKLCEAIEKGKDIKNIEGIAYRQKEKIIKTGLREPIVNIDVLPFPARDLIDMSLYRPHTYIDKGKKSATMITSRGCPYRCIFCASHITMGRKFRAHSPEYVIREIRHLVEDYKVEHIVLNDDTFTLDPGRVKKICKELISKRIKVEWSCLARTNTVSYEILELMKEAGCSCIAFGVESGDPHVLKALKKGTTIEHSRRAFDIANELEIKTIAFFIFGAPGDNITTIKKTTRFAKELKPTLAIFNMMIPYPGTEIFEKGYQYLLELDNWEEFVAIGPCCPVEGGMLSKKQIQKLVFFANISFYFRLSQLFRIIKSIKTLKELLIYLRGGYGWLKQIIRWKRG